MYDCELEENIVLIYHLNINDHSGSNELVHRDFMRAHLPFSEVRRRV